MNDHITGSVSSEEEQDAEFDAERLKNMPSHFVYVEAPDDAGRLMRVGALWQHASGAGWALRLDKNQNARQLVYEHGDDLVVLRNKKHAALSAAPGGGDGKDKTVESFDHAVHPGRPSPGQG